MLRPSSRAGLFAALATLALAPAAGAQDSSHKTKVNPAAAAARIAQPPQRVNAAAAAAVLVPPSQRTIPRVIGLRIDSARIAVQASDVGVVRRDSGTTGVLQDHVVWQSPPAGTRVVGNMIETLYVALAPAPTPLQPRGGRGGVVPKKPAGDALPTGTSDGPPPPARMKVPNLSGLPLAAARTLLAQNNLRLTDTSAESTEVALRGLVFQQNPKAGSTVLAGTGVAVWYSLGPHRQPLPIVMPNVVGRTVDQATELLRKPELRLISVDSVRAKGGNGMVDHQLPEAGTPVHSGEPVSLHVTLPPAVSLVPAVVGMYTARARAVLEKSGFRLGSVTHVAHGRADSTIFAQTPGPGASAERGTPVDVEENTLIPPRKIAVPDISGLTLDSASRVLSNDSLQAGPIRYTDEGADPRVVRQSPAAGDSLLANQFVGVTLTTPRNPATLQPPPPSRDTVQVPNVTGISFEKARRTLEAADLVAEAVADTMSEPRVIAQSRRPGSFVAIHSVVELSLAGTPRPAVPDVVGLSQRAAEDHLRLDGFDMAVRSESRALLSFVARVSAQRPPAGSRLSQDLPVSVDLTIPLVPPIPASITVVLVGAVAVIGKRVWPPRPDPHTSWHPITDLGFDFKSGAPSPPVLHAATPENLAKAIVSFDFDTPPAAWRVTPNDTTLVKG